MGEIPSIFTRLSKSFPATRTLQEEREWGREGGDIQIDRKTDMRNQAPEKGRSGNSSPQGRRWKGWHFHQEAKYWRKKKFDLFRLLLPYFSSHNEFSLIFILPLQPWPSDFLYSCSSIPLHSILFTFFYVILILLVTVIVKLLYSSRCFIISFLFSPVKIHFILQKLSPVGRYPSYTTECK